MDQLLSDLKQKMAISSKWRKISFLLWCQQLGQQTSWLSNLVWHSIWSKTIIAETLWNNACTTQKTKGKALSEVKNEVVNSHESDEFVRMSPGKKDCVSVIIGEQRLQKQKRLLLMNMKELYAALKEQTSGACKFGFSKFCELRPM